MNFKKILLLLFFSIYSFNVYAVLSQTYALEQTAYQECVIDRDSTNGNTQNSGNGGATCTQLQGLAPSYSHTYDHGLYSPPRQTYKHYYYNTSCPVNEPLDLITGLCTPINNTVCNNGDTAQFSLPEEASNGVLTICIGACTRTVNHNGCEYVVSDMSTECFINNSTSPASYSCNYSGVANGNSTISSIETNDYNPDASVNPDSCTDINGLDICKSETTDCAMVNGQEACVVTGTGCGSLDGKKVCFDDPQNCGYLNGKYVCVQSFNTPGSSCISNGTDSFCFKDGKAVETSETTTVTTNQDNSVTTTTSNDSNVLNSQTSSSSITVNSDGSSNSQTSGLTSGQLDTGSLNSIEKNTKSIDNHTKSIDEKLTTFLDTSSTEGSVNQHSNDLDTIRNDNSSGIVSEILSTTNPFINLSNTLVSDWIPLLPTTTTCSGVIDTFIFGHQFYLDPCDKLQPLRVVLEWVFSILASISIFNLIFSTQDPK